MHIEQLAGTKLGNYEIKTLLGRREIGVVYKARQTSLKRPAAPKILPLHPGPDSLVVKRLQREVQAIARRHHASIVQIYDIGEDQNPHLVADR